MEICLFCCYLLEPDGEFCWNKIKSWCLMCSIMASLIKNVEFEADVGVSERNSDALCWNVIEYFEV